MCLDGVPSSWVLPYYIYIYIYLFTHNIIQIYLLYSCTCCWAVFTPIFFGGERGWETRCSLLTLKYGESYLNVPLMSGDSIKAISITATVPHPENEHETLKITPFVKKIWTKSFIFAFEGLRLRIQQLYDARFFVSGNSLDHGPVTTSNVFRGVAPRLFRAVWISDNGAMEKKALKFG